MTKEQAVKILKADEMDDSFDWSELGLKGTEDFNRAWDEAYDMAIKALEQEPCDDTISKHMVLETIDSRIEQIKKDADAINKSYSHLSYAEGVYNGYCRLKCDLWDLPSVTPKILEPCEDCISREKAIKEFQIYREYSSNRTNNDWVDRIEKVLECLPPITPESMRLWIPVSERLPKDGTWNIFTDGKNISVERYKMDAIDHFYPEGRWFDFENAIAWLPLPEQYKEESITEQGLAYADQDTLMSAT